MLIATLLLNLAPALVYAQEASTSSNEELEKDLDLYEKYQKYEKYKKYKDYKDYKEAKEKYAFKSSTDRIAAKEAYRLYKETKNQKYYEDYNKYKKYKNKYKPLKKYAKYGKYSKYNKSENKRYGSVEYKDGYNRYKNYLASTNTVSGNLGEANLGGGPLGPEITVGLWNYTRDNLKDSPFKLQANRAYTIKNGDGTIVGQVAATSVTRVTYESDGNLKIYDSLTGNTIAISAREVFFEDTAGDNSAIVFDIYRPDSDFDQYRGKVKLRYNSSSKLTWVINTLPLEHYVWGMGEITGTGDTDYNRVMTTSFRTYGYWKLKFSTKYAADGFKVNATPGNQLYYGYDWETGHTRILDAAVDTQGKIVMYKGQIAITPYSSWTDGRTRSFEERWGSADYPWCQSVGDPYGKHATKSTATLEAEGNHMVGLSAHGALTLADVHSWDWDRIIKYYYTGIDIKKVY
ncbi:MAG: SpoIID/LytB domain-containing protein [Candidatus Moranbacteria bacterium GW2011_GWE1_35_17]|nr:MAG: SpoIID/LytB domain-containing protein [Candidatus Moranbacteria bacterium GW2011_GWE1_35_17]KKP71547.1 MAG: SpoIID/LytB domain-containing protein [Candidatus Moranbacteria bacterium GW2011_GWE2_35_164]KKP84340.1 MAG: SpoIID/LytB domain-containing protein [Candidatus Moranbacteria bacterium GW2011_GWF1_35_5]KKP84767.1 MAG: SpoIID/LytB domain-containing protein [Candidatus Moranbacteria bacterium GW2011_GWF2_35_54]